MILASALFCCAGVLGLYISLARRRALSRHIFDVHETSVSRATFFLLVLLASVVNVRALPCV